MIRSKSLFVVENLDTQSYRDFTQITRKVFLIAKSACGYGGHSFADSLIVTNCQLYLMRSCATTRDDSATIEIGSSCRSLAWFYREVQLPRSNGRSASKMLNHGFMEAVQLSMERQGQPPFRMDSETKRLNDS